MKKLLLGSIGALALLVSSVGVKAQTITYTGTTAVTFTGPTAPGFTITGGGTTLNYNGTMVVQAAPGTFNNFTTSNVPPHNTVIIGANNHDNLGGFAVGTLPPPGQDVSQGVNVAVTFTAPNITGGNGQSFTGNVTGTVNFQDADGIMVATFNPDHQNFTFNGPGATAGTFTLHVDPVNISSGESGFITGKIVVNIVPEPGSLALFLPGLAPMGFLLRRRRRSSRS